MARIKQYAYKSAKVCDTKQEKRLKAKLQTKRDRLAGNAALGKTTTDEPIKEGDSVFKHIDTHQTMRQVQLPKAPFDRLARQIINKSIGLRKNKKKVQASAFDALREAVDLTGFFEDANLSAAHARRQTVKAKDMKLLTVIREGEASSETPAAKAARDQRCTKRSA